MAVDVLSGIEDIQRQASEIFPNIVNGSCYDAVVVGREESDALSDLGSKLGALRPSGFELPVLVKFGFETLLGLEFYGPEEKMRWGVGVTFKGHAYGFELRKLGFRALCEAGQLNSPGLREFLGRTRQLCDLVAKHFKTRFTDDEIRAGNITIVNVFYELRERYTFLRSRASRAYKAKPPKPKIIVDPNDPNSSSTIWQPNKRRREGAALGSAAVDAYFSMLEHLFCIAVAFDSRTYPTDLKEFLGARWATKATTVLNLSNPKTKNLYDRLVILRDEWRNPLSHGGLMQGSGSLYFHVGGLGALPARLNRTATGVQVGLAIPPSSFSEIIAVLDEFDEQLKTEEIPFTMEWADSGLEVAYDPESLNANQEAMTSMWTFKRYIEGQQRLDDYHNNMEY